MNRDLDRRLQRPLVLLVAISLRSFSGLAEDNPPNSKGVANSEANPINSGSKSGRQRFLICLGVVGAVVLAVCLFKLCQKKKREEQHARLWRLFEEDDELELELGLRD